MKALHMIAFIILVIGGLNWGLEVFGVGIGNYLPSGVATTIYALVGLSAIYEAVTHKKNCTACSGGGSSQGGQQMGGGQMGA